MQDQQQAEAAPRSRRQLGEQIAGKINELERQCYERAKTLPLLPALFGNAQTPNLQRQQSLHTPPAQLQLANNNQVPDNPLAEDQPGEIEGAGPPNQRSSQDPHHPNTPIPFTAQDSNRVFVENFERNVDRFKQRVDNFLPGLAGSVNEANNRTVASPPPQLHKTPHTPSASKHHPSQCPHRNNPQIPTQRGRAEHVQPNTRQQHSGRPSRLERQYISDNGKRRQPTTQ